MRVTISEDTFPEIYAGICAYAAGIIDGEGCIGIEKSTRGSDYRWRQNKRGYRMSVYVTVCNTNLELLEWLEQRFGGYIKEERHRHLGWKRAWAWRLCSIQAGNLLKLVIPYLIVKRRQAEIAIELQNTKIAGKPLSDEQDAYQISKYMAMRELNKKGGIS